MYDKTMMEMSGTELSKKLTDDTVFVLKQDLKTENHTFRAGTRVAFEEKYRTMYHSSYNVYSADKTDYMYIHRTEELRELLENILETDTDRTDQYKLFLSETHINVSAIFKIILYVTGFIALTVFLWRADTDMNFIQTLFINSVMFFVLAMSCFTDICLDMVRLNRKTQTELVDKRIELLQN